VALASANQLVGAIVAVQPGIYSQPRLTLAGSGTTFNFSPGAVLVGTSTKPTTWTPVAGYPHVYSTPTGSNPGLVGQRSPTTWVPIYVDDRIPPFTQSLGRPFYLTEPVKFKPVTGLPAVEAQSGTYWFNAGALNVHMYHDGPPVPADDLYIAPSHYGSLLITGQDHVLDGLTIRQSTGTGLWVQTAARRIIVRNHTAVNSQTWIEGVDTLLEGANISHVIAQGAAGGTECYDANPGVGMGECWNAGGSGHALLIGRGGAATVYNQTAVNVYVHRSWNLMDIAGPNTLSFAKLWGAPNHAITGSGSGVTIQNSQMLNTQDSIYVNDVFASWTLRRNTAIGAVYLTTQDGVTPMAGPVVLDGNIFSTVRMDRRVYEAVQTNCNVWLEDGSTMMEILPTGGVPGNIFTTVAGMRAYTGQDVQSFAIPSLTVGTPFKYYTVQADEAFDFSDPLTVCGGRAGL
jgi:hypothetical protein